MGEVGPKWPGLDGLRGTAAVAVLFFHANLGFARNGYVGVEVFFALSGFLISSILLAELHRIGRVRFARFYLRRALRLLPALVATCLGVLALGVATGRADEMAGGVLAALAYVANWWIYTGHAAPLLEHTWTLAIEEHFYLVWPVLLLGLFARRPRVRIATAVVAAVVVVLVLTPWPEPIDAVRETYLRGFPIIWGSLLAVAVRHRAVTGRGHLIRWPALLALVALLVMLCIPWEIPESVLTGPAGLAGLLSLVVLAGIVLAPASPTAVLMSWPVMRWAGTRSYGMYLYHFPVLSLLRHHVDVGPESARVVVGIATTLVVTELSFRWLESPFLRLKDRVSPKEPASR